MRGEVESAGGTGAVECQSNITRQVCFRIVLFATMVAGLKLILIMMHLVGQLPISLCNFG